MKEEQENLTNHIPVVWIEDEQVHGVVRSLGAWVSLVEYTKGGFRYKVWLENDDFEIVKYVGFHEEEL